jgi:hypothetical protein
MPFIANTTGNSGASNKQGPARSEVSLTCVGLTGFEPAPGVNFLNVGSRFRWLFLVEGNAGAEALDALAGDELTDPRRTESSKHQYSLFCIQQLMYC